MKRTNIEPLSVIIAVDKQGGFGKDGKIPWYFPKDFKHFQQITKNNICIMGWNTYQDIYSMRVERKSTKGQGIVTFNEILPGRQSYVITSKYTGDVCGARAFPTIRRAIYSIDANDSRQIFVLGGYRMFLQALPWTTTVYMTIVNGVYNCDKFFPLKYLNRCFKITDGSKDENLTFIKYERTLKV